MFPISVSIGILLVIKLSNTSTHARLIQAKNEVSAPEFDDLELKPIQANNTIFNMNASEHNTSSTHNSSKQPDIIQMNFNNSDIENKVRHNTRAGQSRLFGIISSIGSGAFSGTHLLTILGFTVNTVLGVTYGNGPVATGLVAQPVPVVNIKDVTESPVKENPPTKEENNRPTVNVNIPPGQVVALAVPHENPGSIDITPLKKGIQRQFVNANTITNSTKVLSYTFSSGNEHGSFSRFGNSSKFGKKPS